MIQCGEYFLLIIWNDIMWGMFFIDNIKWYNVESIFIDNIKWYNKKCIFIDIMWEIFFIDNIKWPNVESIFIDIMLDYLLIILN